MLSLQVFIGQRVKFGEDADHIYISQFYEIINKYFPLENHVVSSSFVSIKIVYFQIVSVNAILCCKHSLMKYAPIFPSKLLI